MEPMNTPEKEKVMKSKKHIVFMKRMGEELACEYSLLIDDKENKGKDTWSFKIAHPQKFPEELWLIQGGNIDGKQGFGGR